MTTITNSERIWLSSQLIKTPDVNWDRFVSIPSLLSKKIIVYGWIKRPDTHEDFLITNINISKRRIDSVMSSSPNKTFERILVGQSIHSIDCERIEWFLNIPNMIRLNVKPQVIIK